MNRQGVKALLLLVVIGLIVGLSSCGKTPEPTVVAPPPVETEDLNTTIQNLRAENADLKAEVKRLEGLLSECDRVYITKTGTKYHRLECRYVAGKECVIPLSRELAIKCGYEACSVCKP